MPLILCATLAFLSGGDAQDPPIAGQPPGFNGAVGTFRATARLDTDEVQTEHPVLYTVRITPVGSVQRPPRRPRLADVTTFSEAFFLEDLEPLPGQAVEGGGWEFLYRLRPKSTGVDAVPRFPFIYYKPGVLPPSRGYQTIYLPRIPLRVRERTTVPEAAEGRPFTAPEEAFLLAKNGGGPKLGEERLPGVGILALLTLLPPTVSLIWWWVWRRSYPEAALKAKQQMSQAARRALDALHAAQGSVDARARAQIVADYLRDRSRLPQAFPTPLEVRAHLQKMGLPETLVQRACEYFHACEAERFAPVFLTNSDPVSETMALIVALEEAPWSSAS